MRRLATVLCVVGMLSSSLWAARSQSPGRGLSGGGAGRFSDDAVERAIGKAVKFLLSKQRKDGSWGHYAEGKTMQTTGPTALVVYALLESGMNPQDKRLAKSLEWMAKLEAAMTYSLACRASAWSAANRSTNGKYYKQLITDMRILVASSNYGNHTYQATGHPIKGFDNSNSQFGLLGAWAARMDGREVPLQYWKSVMGHWEREQQPDGGWQYSPKHLGGSCGTMTVGGVASLYVCIDNLYGSQFLSCGRPFGYKPILRGLDWIDKNFQATMANVTRHAHGYYYLYGIERVGLASGYKYFGTQDWYKIGAVKLIASQEANGSWSSPENIPADPANDPNFGNSADGKQNDGKSDKKRAMADPPVDADGWTVLAGPSPGRKPSPPRKGGGGGRKKGGGKPGPPPPPYYDKPGEWRLPDEPQVWDKDVSDTAFALLFLIRGRHPVLINKVEYEGDWNNRPRDLASLTLWLSRTFERTMNWQTISLKVPVRELQDAPILYIAGSKAPRFSKEELDKLRTFVQQGGCLLSVTECNGGSFSTGMAAVYAKLFPQYELTPLGAEHDLYDLHYRLGGKPELSIVFNGVRPLAIHTKVDLAKSWQTRKIITEKEAFEIAANMYLYLTGAAPLRPRGTSNWPARGGSGGGPEVEVIRLKHNGNGNPEPLAWDRFSLLMRNAGDAQVKVSGPSPIASVSGAKGRVAVLSGTNEFTLSDAEKASLKRFVEDGGTLLVDVIGGVKMKINPTGLKTPTGFAVSAEQLLADLFGAGSLQRLPENSPLRKAGKDSLAKVGYRPATRRRLTGLKGLNLRVVMVGKRPGVIYSQEDLTAGLLGVQADSIDGYVPDDAVRVVRSIVLNAARS